MKKLITLLTVLLSLNVIAQEVSRVEPPNWWAGMKSPDLQLLVYGDGISTTDVAINYEGVEIVSVTKVVNENYLFVDLKLSTDVKPGNFDVQFMQGEKVVDTYNYELWEREKGSAERTGFNTEDVIYLITPDRFVNGDTTNDEVEGMKEGLDRDYNYGRHGGDLRGIINSLDYSCLVESRIRKRHARIVVPWLCLYRFFQS